jgi:hypothetical protein
MIPTPEKKDARWQAGANRSGARGSYTPTRAYATTPRRANPRRLRIAAIVLRALARHAAVD